jgi:hypothetical protein
MLVKRLELPDKGPRVLKTRKYRIKENAKKSSTAFKFIHTSIKKPVLRIRDVYPGSRILIFTHFGSRISDPKTATKERGEKRIVLRPFFVATNFTKLKIILFFKC